MGFRKAWYEAKYCFCVLLKDAYIKLDTVINSTCTALVGVRVISEKRNQIFRYIRDNKNYEISRPIISVDMNPKAIP